MHGDFSRNTFRPTELFTRVLLQQGRPQLDADYNELVAVLLHWQRELAKDVVGDHGTFADAASKSFQITLSSDNRFLFVDNGRYYVDGILCENLYEAGGLAASTPLPLINQTGYPFADSDQLTFDGAEGATNKFLIYLDAWERMVIPDLDPHLLETALLGADTASRSRIVWQVKARRYTDEDDNELDLILARIRRDQTKPRLRAKAVTTNSSSDPCITPPNSKYRGLENQLYRVEIHSVHNVTRNGQEVQDATFKWSRENGSVVFPITGFKVTAGEGQSTVVATVGHLGRDARRTLQPGDWAEVLYEDTELTGKSGYLLKVAGVDREENVVTFTYPNGLGISLPYPPLPVLLRRWDQRRDVIESTGETTPAADVGNKYGAIEIKDGQYVGLEDGVEVQFVAPTPPSSEEEPPRDYRVGDYWLIPARVETGDVEWPSAMGRDPAEPEALEPNGIQRHVAPLRTLTVANGGDITLEEEHRRVIKREFAT